MSSPKLEVFFLYDPSTGAPKPGQTGLSFLTYKTDQGVAVSPLPTIVEIGGGAYGFLPAFSDTARGIVYVIGTGTGVSPTSVARYMRPEDWTTDNLDVLLSSRASQASVNGLGGLDLSIIQTKLDRVISMQEGKWEIKTIGPDANHLIFYQADGVTVLRKFELFDSSGVPTAINPFKRVPV